MQHFLELRRLAATLVVCLAVTGCAHAPGPGVHPGLAPMPSRAFDSVFADAAREDAPQRVHVGGLLAQDVEISEPLLRGPGVGRDWTLGAAEVAGIERLWVARLSAAIEAHPELELVEAHGDGVHVVTARLVELAPTAPRDDLRSRAVRRTFVTRGAGQVTLRLDVHDETGLRATVLDRRDAGAAIARNDRFRNSLEFRRLLARWADDVAELVATLPVDRTGRG